MKAILDYQTGYQTLGTTKEAIYYLFLDRYNEFKEILTDGVEFK